MQMQRTIFRDYCIQNKDMRNRIAKHNACFSSTAKVTLKKCEKQIVCDRPELFSESNPTFSSALTSELLNSWTPRPCKIITRPEDKQKHRLIKKFSKHYNFIYFFIGEKKSSFWGQFEDIYNQINKQGNLENLSTSEDLKFLRLFLQGGMQVKLISEGQAFHRLNNSFQFQQILSKQLLLDVWVESTSENQVMIEKIKIVDNFSRFLSEIKQEIEMSKKNIIYYNFIHFDLNSSQLFARRSVIQKCLYPKSKAYLIQTIGEFTALVDECLDSPFHFLIAKQKKQKKPNVEQIRKLQKLLMLSKKQQMQFCSKFREYLQKDPLIEHRSEEEQQEVYLSLIKQYKEEHSIYGLLNNTIKKSFSSNESLIGKLSVYIKYLFEGIWHYFGKHLQSFQFQQNKVYRGGKISRSELESLKEQKFIWNLGFMSSSKVRSIAQSFKNHPVNLEEERDIRYLIIIEIPPEFKDPSLLDKHEGFIEVQKCLGDLKYNEEEILFNPLNVFEVKSINKIKKQITLIYAPHLSYLQKQILNVDSITQEQKIKFKPLLDNIIQLERKKYDPGQEHREKGDPRRAVDYYEAAEQEHQKLSIDQKIAFLDCLVELNEFDKLEQQLDKMLKQEQLQNQEQENEQKEIDKILLLTKQSEIFQETTNYEEAERKAQKAFQKIEQMRKANEKDMGPQDFLDLLKIESKSLVNLTKSNSSTSSYIESALNVCYGFKVVEYFYEMQLSLILPQIKQALSFVNLENEKAESIRQILQMNCANSEDLVRIKNRHLVQLKEQYNNLKISSHQNIIRQSNNLMESQVLYQPQLIKVTVRTTCQQYDQFFQQHSSSITVFFKAIQEINVMQTKTKELKKAKSLLSSFREEYKNALEVEKNLYETLRQNLKALHVDLIPCLKSEKQNYYKRFEVFVENEKIECEQVTGEKSSSEIVKNQARYGQFLLEYSEIVRDEQSNKFKEKALSLLLSAKESFSKQENEGLYTNEKTKINQILLENLKSNCMEKQIMEKVSTINLTKDSSSTMDTSSGQSFKLNDLEVIKERKSKYDQMMALLEQVYSLHKNDKKVNQLYYILKDMNQFLGAYNESSSLCTNSKAYIDELQKARRKIDQFETEYADIRNRNKSRKEDVATFIFRKAQNSLRRGYISEAKHRLKQANEMLDAIYQEQSVRFGRKICISCYKLRAEITGIYESVEEKRKIIAQLMKVRDFINEKIHSPSNEADINEALGFLAARYYSLTKNPQMREEGRRSLERSIQILRKRLNYESKQEAILITYLMELSTEDQNEESLTRIYKRGEIIFKNIIKERMITQPMLFIYKMRLERLFQLRIQEVRQGREEAPEVRKLQKKEKEKIYESYKVNSQEFIKFCIGTQGLWASKQLSEGGSFMLAQKNYQYQAGRCFEESVIGVKKLKENQLKSKNQQINEEMMENPSMEQLNKEIKYFLFNGYATLISYFDRYGPSTKKKQYQKELTIFKSEHALDLPPQKQQQKENFFDFIASALFDFAEKQKNK